MKMGLRAVWYGLGGLLLAAIAVLVVMSFGGKEWATVQVGQAEKYTFRVADNPLERAQGLSGLALGALDADGMMFTFNDDAPRTFTMKGMQFDLDIIWIRDNKIVNIDHAVGAPVDGAEPLQVSSSPLLVDMVLEVPAGRVEQMNFLIGHTLTIE